MNNFIVVFAVFLLSLGNASAGEKPNTVTAQEKREGYILLFDGHSLAGWDGDPKIWSVKDGAIVGSTDHHSVKHNTCLIYREPYSDFILKVEVKLRNGNSGIQFRSKVLPDWVVTGYQADASEAGERSAWGNLYEERGRGRGLMASPDEGWRTGKKVYRQGEWNEYEIYAKGHHLRLKINGVETVVVEDDKAASGVIAIQVHRGPPMEVQLRNIRIKPL